MQAALAAVLVVCGLSAAAAQPFLPGSNPPFLPTGQLARPHRAQTAQLNEPSSLKVLSAFQCFESPTVCAGNLLTSDQAGPYNISLLPVQYNEIRAALAQRQSYTDLE